MMTALFLGAALLTPQETELTARLSETFAKASAHYKALDAVATPLMKDEKDELRTPHGFNRTTRQLDMRSIYWWTSGHFPGTLWYLYEVTGDTALRDRAVAWTEILAPVAKYRDNHDVGFMMYCSYGNARRILKTDRYDALLRETAESLSTRYDDGLGLIRSWGKVGNKDEFLVIPDNMMNLELLEATAAFSGEKRFADIARSHADISMRHHFRPDGGCYHVLNYDQRPGFRGTVQEIRRGQGLSCETAWSRGQAWGIYGYTMMYRMTGQVRYRDFAQKLADYAMNHPNMPADGIPYWDFGAPGEERDSSAGAVMSSGLLELSQQVGVAAGARYRAFAVKQLLALSSSAYFSEGDEIGHFLLKHGVGHKPGNSEVDTPLDYGDYYFLEALLRFRNLCKESIRAAEVVTYEQFGAKGDGVANDLPAIVAAHKAANAKGLPVRAKDDATYYIGGEDLTAEIRTDTDLGTARFVIDDRAVTNCNAALYRIPAGGNGFAVTGVASLTRGMKSLGVTLPCRALVKLEDDGRRQYRRTGNVNMTNDGSPQYEFLIVDVDGTIDPTTPVVQDMAHVSRARAYPIDDKPLRVRGGRFKTIANREIAPKFHKWNYYHRGFTVTRSNVLVSDFRHEIVDQQPDISPYSGFLCVNKAVAVTVSNCVFTAHRMTTHGTYDMNLSESVGIRFVNCREVTDILDTGNFWAYGSNYCRDLTLDGCEFGRFDAHCGTYNATIRNCRLRQVNAVGWGTFLVENTRVEGGNFCWYRGDYGSNWDGDFIVRNCTWAPQDGKGSAFVSAQNDGTHDYGYPCHMGRKIVIDGLTVKVSRPFTWFLFFSDEPAADAPYPYLPPEEVTLRNVTVEGGHKPVLSNHPKFFHTVTVKGL